MKKEIFNWCLFISIILITNNINAQKIIDISKYNCFTAPVKYLAEDGVQEGVLLFVRHNDLEFHALHYTNVYLLGKDGRNFKIVPDSSAFVSVYDVKVSENSKYLALMMVGEGHPWIEIYDLQKLISESKQELIADINPYPGNLNIIGWKNNILMFESDINFLLKNENKSFSDTDIFEKFSKFSFNPVDNKFKELK